MPTVGEVVRQRRKRKGLTQEKLGELIGKDQNYVSLLETGRIKVPSLPTLRLIADALDLPMPQLYEAAGWSGDLDDGTEERAEEADPDIDLADPELHFWASTARELTPEEMAAVKEVARQILRAKGKEVP